MANLAELEREAERRGLISKLDLLEQEAQRRGLETAPAEAVAEAPPEPNFGDRINNAVDNLGGPLDVAAFIGSAALAEPVSGLVGLASLPFTDAEGAVENIEATQEALTFQPRTPVGQAAVSGAGEVLAPVGEALTGAGKSLGHVGETLFPFAPALGHTVGASLPTAVLEFLGFKGINALRGTKKVTGITDEVEGTLARNNVKLDDLSDEGIANLQEAVAADVAAQQKRVEAFQSVGIDDPTKAQVTRDATDFQTQQEVAKTSSRVRETLEGQEAVLAQGFDDTVFGTGGQKVTPGSTAIDEVVGRSTKLDKEVSDLYGQAREVAQGEKNVSPSRLAGTLKRLARSDTVAGGLIESVRGDLIARGVVNKKFEAVGRIDVDTAEEVRKFINSHHDSTTDFGRGVMHELKEALDEDVFSAAGEDIFKNARKAKAEFEKGLSRAKVSKFDKRKKSLVRDMVENRIDPDEFTTKVTQSKAYRAADLDQLKTYLSQTDEGLKAWDDLRAETLQSIKDQAFIGPEDADGFKALSRDKLERSLNRIGSPKRNILFSAQENQFLDRMLEVARLREPVRGTAIGRGPSAQGVKLLQDALARNKALSAVVDTITLDAKGKAVLKGKVPDVPQIELKPKRGAGVAGAAAIGSTDG